MFNQKIKKLILLSSVLYYSDLILNVIIIYNIHVVI